MTSRKSHPNEADYEIIITATDEAKTTLISLELWHLKGSKCFLFNFSIGDIGQFVEMGKDTLHYGDPGVVDGIRLDNGQGIILSGGAGQWLELQDESTKKTFALTPETARQMLVELEEEADTQQERLDRINRRAA